MQEELSRSLARQPFSLSDMNFNLVRTGHSDTKFKIAFHKAFLYNKAKEKYVFDRKENAYDLISAVTSTEELDKIKEEKQKGKGRKNMCKAIDDMLADAREAGEKVGREEAKNEIIHKIVKDYLEEGIPKETICRKLEKLFFINPETARKYFAG